MKFNYKRIHVGRRTLKTAAAVIISIILVSIYGVSASKMTFAMLGAMNAMENTFKRSVENCLTQIVGMICGAIVGILLLQLPIHWLACVGIGIVFIITIYNVFSIKFPPGLPCLIILTICTTTDVHPFAYAIERLWDTAIGLGVGMLVNVLVLPYDNSIKIRNSIEYLEGEVITFLADMFDGDNEYPDTIKMTATIKRLAEDLGILSEQWFPLCRKQNAKRLAILRECGGKSRQLLSHMEVLSQMKMVGCLNAENGKMLKEYGANIRKCKKQQETVSETDVITNYHVEQILKLRRELMEELMQFPAKRIITQRMPIFENGTKSVYTGMSSEFGPVVLKQDANIAQLKSEYYMLAKLNGNHSCKVYAFDEQKGQLLEERILPGTKLREEGALSKRVEAFESVFRAIHIPKSELSPENAKTYVDWLDGICTYCDEHAKEWKDHAVCAHGFATELFEKYAEQVLLHGDLHHDNLLMREAGDYVFVDPKGVFGPEIFDLPRFIINEIDMGEEDFVSHIEAVIASLCERLGYAKDEVRKLVYMEAVLANVWHLEDGEEADQKLQKLAEAMRNRVQ